MQLLYLQDVSMCKLSHRRTCPYATCDIISYVLSRLPCIHAVCRLRDEFMGVVTHTKRRVSAHFLIYEIMSMLNFKHMTPCLSHNFPQVQSKQSTTSRLFLLTNPSHNATFFTYKTSPCVNCHTEGRVCMPLVT